MDETLPLATETSSLAESPGEPGVCKQCGAPLSPYLYFCSICGTSYKGIAAVTGHFVTFKPVGEEAIRKYAPQVWTMFWVYVAAILGSGIVAFAMGGEKEEQIPLSLFLGSVVMAAVTAFYAWRYWSQLKNQFRLAGFLSPWFWAGVGMLVPLLLVNFAYHGALEYFAGLESDDNPVVILVDRFGFATAVVIFCVLPGIIEEVAFRGLLQSWLMAVLRPRSALILASVLFAALHASVISLPYLFAVGLLLGWVYHKTRSLWPCMTIHFLHNLVVILIS